MSESQFKVGELVLLKLGEIPCQIIYIRFQGTIDPIEYGIRYIDCNEKIINTMSSHVECDFGTYSINYVLKCFLYFLE